VNTQPPFRFPLSPADRVTAAANQILEGPRRRGDLGRFGEPSLPLRECAVLKSDLRPTAARRAKLNGRTRLRAFTLMEIMIVVGIIGITLTLGVPAFVHAVHKEGMRKVESDLLEAFKNARGQAIIKGQPQDLVFRPLESTYECAGAVPAATLPPEVGIEFLGVNEMELEHEEFAKVRFNPNGTCDEFVIILDANDGSKCKITLDPVTALAEMELLR
jgi:prepilin-type N-terminal cleavage/methylation domain-containing protein